MVGKLSPKQKRFVDEYLIDLNATQAAIRAGYSKAAAGSVGHEILKKPEIAKAISEAQAAREQRTQITKDRVLQELAKLAFFDIRKIYSDDGALLAIKDIDDSSAAAISGIESSELKAEDGTAFGTIKKVKISDKVAALNLAMKHLGMLTEKVEHSGQIKTAPTLNVILHGSGTAPKTK